MTLCPLGRSEDDAGVAHLLMGSHVQVKRVGPPQWWLWRRRQHHPDRRHRLEVVDEGRSTLQLETSSLSIEALAVDFHASRTVSLSSTFVMAASNPSNFIARSSMAVVIWASNLVCLPIVICLPRSSRIGQKKLEEIWGYRL